MNIALYVLNPNRGLEEVELGAPIARSYVGGLDLETDSS